MSPWLMLPVVLLGVGWVWTLRDPLFRSWRTVALLSTATVLLVAGGLILPQPIGLAFGWLVGVATVLALVRYPDRFSSIPPGEWRFADAFGVADNEAVRISQLGSDEGVDLDAVIRQLEDVNARMMAAVPPDHEWNALKERKLAELSSAISLLRERSVDEVAFRRLRAARHETVGLFRALLQRRARFWR